jgi:O2-independent ubiquinone biosynthesis accessory factor UbiT
MSERPALPPCPPPLAALFERLPPYPAALLLATGLNAVLAPQLPADVGERLIGRKLRIHLRDARVRLDFGWTGRRFAPLARQAQPDLTVSASVPDFLLLAQRREDPDTLFFSRRLSLEGDTELGLVVKNTLDALELPVFDPAALLRRARASSRPRQPPWN